MSYYTPLLGSIPLTLDEIAFIENLAFEAEYNSANVVLGNGIRITVASTAPASPEVNDLWVDIS
jgi:hypothetical protein